MWSDESRFTMFQSDGCIRDFERLCLLHEIASADWVSILAGKLIGKAADAYLAVPKGDLRNYATVQQYARGMPSPQRHIDESSDVNKAIENIIKILSGFNSNIPNYSCRKYGQLAGVIGDLSSQTSRHIANILSIYRYPQISYGATDPHLANKHFYPSLFRTLPNDQIQAEAIVKLLKHFGWTWIGIITIDDENGEIQSRELKQIAVSNGICIEFSLNITPYVNFDLSRIKKNIKTLKSSTSNIIVVCGSVSAFSVFNMEKESEAMYDKTFVIPASWHIQFEIENQAAIILLNGSLVFRHPSKSIPSLQKYLERVSVSSRPHDTLLEMIMAMKQQCLSSDDNMNKVMQLFLRDSLHNCSKDDLLIDLFTQQEYYTQRFQATYEVYKAVYTMAQSLHEMQSFLSSKNLEKYRHKLEHFLRKVHFKDPIGESTTFNENGEIMTVYEINNYILIDDSIVTVVVGTFNPSAPDEGQLIILESEIMWKYSGNKIPQSRCSEDCPPGYRRVSHKSEYICCFDCAPCADGEISSQTDYGFCQKCPGDTWPNKFKDKCIPKVTDYLSFQSDPPALVLSLISGLFSLIASIILCIFLSFRDTPIVKANNQNLSFILLASIILSFLCVFLFLGCPVDITCILRQTSFGIIFSVAVSSLLAKTIMVCIAFKATKPGSTWRKWMGIQVPNCVVFICSFTMVIICISWLSISPPFQEMNTHSYPGKIIIECNEGSVIAFYTVLGYMGFLAAVSFIVAFLVRKLPDSFNEAKYITFSMLVFCNVWITFIPAYMSVMGKNTVIVEIFAIIASSAGILVCIFFPKCYIILLRPHLNTKRQLIKLARLSLDAVWSFAITLQDWEPGHLSGPMLSQPVDIHNSYLKGIQ
ncbi:vomeronasal type-2 receptor 26-like [Pelobates fuscus]|uniref:vomeronasal type-2 receptor 26-like n=1 Tax=Pelobates fuscus TaxID=191477 RepID=UPI002FE48B3C